MSARTRENVAFALALLIGAGFATWLLLPLAQEPTPPAPAPEPVLVAIGPIAVGQLVIGPIYIDLFLVIVAMALSVVVAGFAMMLFVRWLSRFVSRATAAAAAAPLKTAPAAQPVAPAAVDAAAEVDLPWWRTLAWLAVIAAALGAIVWLLTFVLPPGFTLF